MLGHAYNLAEEEVLSVQYHLVEDCYLLTD